MAQPNGVTTSVTSIKWRKEYRHYRASRCRLYVCMILLMVFIVLSVICLTFLFRNSFYFHPKDYELNSGEMRVVHVSTLFCESIVVKPASFKRQVIVVSLPLMTRRTAQNKFISTDVVFLRRDRSWHRSFYLLKSSTVSVSVASRHSVNVYWLKGRRILDKWTDQMRKDLKESSKQTTDIFTGTRMTETFTVNEDNNYYLGITSIAGDTKYSEIFVNTSITRTVYDFRSYVMACNASVGESCQVKLRFNSRDTAVIAVTHNESALRTHDVWVTWYCKPRIWFYCVVFVGILLVVVLFISFVYCCVMSKVKKNIHEWKPHVSVRSKRSEKENDGTVTLQSINYVRASILDDNCENVLELTPLRLTQARDTCQENNKPDTPHAVSTSSTNCWNSVDGVNNNIPTGSARVTSFNDTDCSYSATKEETAQWRRTPSPRWSTFLQDADYIYEECVTDFLESPTNTLELIMKASEDDSFENELMDRLQNLQTDDDIEYDDPVETDIDNYSSDSETYPFLSEASGNNDHMMTESGVVVLRQKDRRKEQRWEPRLSVVTEI